MSTLPRLVALDLDGTLLNAQKVVTPRTLAAVRALSDAGVIVVIATGRMYRDCTEPLAAQLDLGTPVIAYNGAMIVDPGRPPLFEQPVAGDLARPVLDFARATGRHLNLYDDDRLWCLEPNPWADLYVQRTGARPVYRDDLYEHFAGRDSTKLLIIDEPAAIDELKGVWQESMAGRLYVTVSDPEYLEFTDLRATKGQALGRLCEQYGLTLADCAAFGDSGNDRTMLEAAGLGIAMANARPSILEVADAVAPHHDDDGVAQVIEAWLNDRAPAWVVRAEPSV